MMNALPIPMNPAPTTPVRVTADAAGKSASGRGFAQIWAAKQSTSRGPSSQVPANQANAKSIADSPEASQDTAGEDFIPAPRGGREPDAANTPVPSRGKPAPSRRAAKSDSTDNANSRQGGAALPPMSAANLSAGTAHVNLSLDPLVVTVPNADNADEGVRAAAAGLTLSSDMATTQASMQTVFSGDVQSDSTAQSLTDAPSASAPLAEVLPVKLMQPVAPQAEVSGIGLTPEQPDSPASVTLAEPTAQSKAPAASGTSNVLPSKIGAGVTVPLAGQMTQLFVTATSPPQSAQAESLPLVREDAHAIVDSGKTDSALNRGTQTDFLKALHTAASAIGKGVEAVAHVVEAPAADATNSTNPDGAPDEPAPAMGPAQAADLKLPVRASGKPEAAAPLTSPPSTPNLPAQPSANASDTRDAAGPNQNASNYVNSGNNSGDGPGSGPGSGTDNSGDAPQTGLSRANAQPAPVDPAGATGMAASHAAASMAAGNTREVSAAVKPEKGSAGDSSTSFSADADGSKLPAGESKTVNTAQLSGNDAHSEVRIALQADQLGQVQLHATLSGQQVGAAITVEKKEAHAALAVELPSLQQALEDHHLRVNEVVLTQGASHAFSGNAGNPGNPGHSGQAPTGQGRSHTTTQYQQRLGSSAYRMVSPQLIENVAMFDSHGRLSVRV